MKKTILLSLLFNQVIVYSQYAPPAGQVGTSAIARDSSIIVNWANAVVSFNPGLMNISNSGSGNADFGNSSNALGLAEGTSGDIVSLGDNGSITLSFEYPIKNKAGHDFAVFENSFSDTFLELAHVEVSTNGIRFVRLPSISLTQSAAQVSSFGSLDPTKLYNLAGKYRQGYGTPFDLSDIIDSTNINLDSINYVRIVDVVGTINTNYSSYDSQGNVINDPYPTSFSSGGFDLDAIAVINEDRFLGVNEKDNEFYNLYPNPSKGSFYITSKVNCTIDIISINGQTVRQLSISKLEKLFVPNLENGIYLIKFNNSKKTYVKKIIVNQ